MKEQKLFFTRNGVYTPWEMLNHLPEHYLDLLYNYTVEKMWSTTSPGRKEEFPSFLYRKLKELKGDEQEGFFGEISAFFKQLEPPKSDFNAYMYHYSADSFDLRSVEANLEKLQTNSSQFGIDQLDIIFFTHEKFGDLQNVVDIRFTSPRSSFYKESEIVQMLNTEIRVYLDLGIALMTNFSKYTHSDTEKVKFINHVIHDISSSRGEIKPIQLSDRSLRNLLLMDKKIPSKLNFEVEGRLKIKFDIYEDTTMSELQRQDEIKYIYDRYQLSQLKVKISEGEEDKYLNIDGSEGRLISRTHNLDVSDIDRFIERIGALLKYDYLNHSYEKELKAMAMRELTGTSIQKNNQINICYRDVERTIKSNSTTITNDIRSLIRNAFFYCLYTNVFPEGKEGKQLLEQNTSRVLSKVTRHNDLDVNSLFDTLLGLIEESNGDFGELIVKVDHFVNQTRVVNHVTGV